MKLTYLIMTFYTRPILMTLLFLKRFRFNKKYFTNAGLIQIFRLLPNLSKCETAGIGSLKDEKVAKV